MYPSREVFPSSPLALVATEIRFTDSARLRQQATLDKIAIALDKLLPVQGHQQQADVQVVVGGEHQIRTATGRLMRNRESTVAMTLFPDRLTYETTAYTEFDTFRADVLRCVHAVVDVGVAPAIQRIGLRYLDEIRLATPVPDPRDWGGWIDSRLVDQLNVGPADKSIRRAEGFVGYDLGEGRGLNFRFAALPSGAVVVPQTLVRPPFDNRDPFFVLDFDGYRDFKSPNATLLDANVVAITLDAVHGPAGATFQNAITDQARALFRTRRS